MHDQFHLVFFSWKLAWCGAFASFKPCIPVGFGEGAANIFDQWPDPQAPHMGLTISFVYYDYTHSLSPALQKHRNGSSALQLSVLAIRNVYP